MTEEAGSSSAEQPEPPRNRYQRVVAWVGNTWSANTAYLAAAFGIATVFLIPLAAFQTFELHQRYPITNWGNVPEALAAFGTVLAVVVALWQSNVIRRQAEQERTDAAEQLEKELTSASELHAAEMKAADERHTTELATQREIARVQRVALREQEFKLALIRVSRAASAYTHQLATLVAETPRILSGTSRQERDDALKPISKQLGALVQDLAAEISGAHMLTNNDELHNAVDRINVAALKGPPAEIDFRNTAVMAGQHPNEAPIFMVMEELQRAIGDARRLAGRLLVTSWD